MKDTHLEVKAGKSEVQLMENNWEVIQKEEFLVGPVVKG
jgi:hypothetical protein